MAWCTPPLLPKAWTDQVADDGLIVAPLPIADVPNMTVVAKVRIRGGEPVTEAVFTGGYVEATASPKGDLDPPGRWVDWENRVPGPSWISLAWRAQDDRLHTGARTTLDRLLNAAHTEPYEGGDVDVDWPSWRTFAAALGTPQLTMAGLRPGLWAIGHSTTETAAVIQQDGVILADSPDSPSLPSCGTGSRPGRALAARPLRPTPPPSLPQATAKAWLPGTCDCPSKPGGRPRFGSELVPDRRCAVGETG
ncbi:hypothetical protein OG863_01490 [Streptomyces decoyicus]|uniref:Uncharacterized protein n=1 Tax=Streptomyces decoyicus TaxID=249567 RepID=A0ABZ1F8V0_9ACTN|nr:hypothetical protein [Streptomyces decoyicus]WSB66744.1 hypothetical protein OG863_01490 [Streptomyces decoyicus]